MRPATSPNNYGGRGSLAGGRVRSASPGRRALAIDMRRMANLLRDPPTLGGDGSLDASICSSPSGGAAGAASQRAAMQSHLAAMAEKSQISALTEKINAAVSNIQWQCSEDRRRLSGLERKLDSFEERSAGSDTREKWADLQGSVNGLIEETQSLTRRVESLDERLWARTSGADSAKQRSRELEQQVQALEHQVRLSTVSSEEAQKRQAAKVRRSEHAVEEVVRRLAKVEEQARTSQQQHQNGYALENRLAALEQQLSQFGDDMQDVQAQIDEGLAGGGPLAGGGGFGPVQNEGVEDSGVEESLRATERNLAAMDRRLTEKVDEVSSTLASMKVKVDGQLQRVSTLSERLETAHTPALDALRSELTGRMAQDRRELENEASVMRERVREMSEGNEEFRESLRQAQVDVAALSLKQQQSQSLEESQAIRNLDERCMLQERELVELRARFDSIVPLDDLGDGGEDDEDGGGMKGRTGTLGPELMDGVSGIVTGGGIPPGFKEEIEEACRSSDRRVGQLEQRLAEKVEELTLKESSLRIKVDGQQQRLAALSERLERHEPALESLRSELANSRSQDRRQLESQLDAMQRKLQDLASAKEDGENEMAHSEGSLKELIGQVRVEFEALAKSHEAQEDDLRDLRELFEQQQELGLSHSVAQQPSTPGAKASAALSVSGGAEAEQAMKGLSALEKRVAEQAREVEDATKMLASLKVKVDGQGQRVDSLADRIDSAAQASEIDALRGEVSKARQQDETALQSELEKLRSWAQDLIEEACHSGAAASAAPDPPAAAAASKASEEALRTLEGRVQAQEREVSQLARRVDALPAQTAPKDDLGGEDIAELREELGELDERLKEVEARGKEKEESPWRKEVEALEAKVAEVSAAASASTAAAAGDGGAEAAEAAAEKAEKASKAADDLRVELAELADRLGALEDQLDDVRQTAEQAASASSASASKPQTAQKDEALAGEVETLKKQLDEVRKTAEKASAAAAGAAEAAEAATEAAESGSARQDGDSGLLKEDLEKGLAAAKKSAEDALADERAALDEAMKELEDKGAETGKLVSSLRAQVETLEASTAKRLEDVGAKLEAAAACAGAASVASSSPKASADGDLARRLSALEDRIAIGGAGAGAGAGGGAAGDDDEAREKVRGQVEDMTKQLAEELAALARHQKELVEAKASVQVAEAAKTQISAGAGAGEAVGAVGLSSLTERVDGAMKRLQALEETTGTVRKDLDQLQGPRKVGISMSGENFSLADARDKLELHSEQISELQARGVGGGGISGAGGAGAGLGGGAAGSRSKPGQVATPEASLNFSLTEQPDRLGGAGGGGGGGRGGMDDSLGFSMTGSKQDFSLTDSVPILNMPPQRRGGAGAGGVAGGGGGGGAGSIGGSDLDSDVEFDIEDTEVLEEESPKAAKVGLGGATSTSTSSAASAKAAPKKDAKGGGGDILDALVGSGQTKASGVSLARVDEETSDLGDGSIESRMSRSGSRQSPASKSRSSAPGGGGGVVGGGGAGAVPESPQSVSGSAGVDAHGLEISMSCNEVSYGGDYSVEDSCELDKCDHVEEVKPSGPLQKQVAASAVGRGASSSSPTGEATKPKAAAGIAGAAPGEKSPVSPKDADESNSYADEGFEGAEESVSEFIEEELDSEADD